MTVISVRVPKSLKERMSRVQENWADYIRRMIERRIKEQEMIEASKTIDKIRLKTREEIFDAAKSIREDRDRT